MVSLLGKTLKDKYNEYDDSNDNKPKSDLLKRKYDEVVVDNNDDDDDEDDVKVEIPIKIATPISKIPVSNETEYDSLIEELRCYKDGKFIDLRKEKG